MEKDPLAALTKGSRDDLGFDKNDFLKENFSVDEFLHKNRGAPSLEQLRDNLGIYLKDLRAAMIDLINEDYADFINLSANLDGLDKNIDSVEAEVQKAKEDIQTIGAFISEQITLMNLELENQKQVRLLRHDLESLKKFYLIHEQLKKLLAQPTATTEFEIGLHLERSAIQLQQLEFHAKCADEYISLELKKEHEELITRVDQNLREYFINSLKVSSSVHTESLERSLNIYTTLNAEQKAEQVFREDVVVPFMSDIISEQSLENCPQGLGGIYGRILNFISIHMTDLLRLTLYTDNFSGFNFLVNAFWAEVADRIGKDMTSIFAPGNAEIFYAKYTCTRDFMQKIQDLLADKQELNEFYQHTQTQTFNQRWNLPVYYQICFQEIAAEVEESLNPLIDENTVDIDNSAKDEDNFLLIPVRSAYKGMQRCWMKGVFLPEILPKFFKLNIQVVDRFLRYCLDLIEHIKKETVDIQLDKSTILAILYADIQKLSQKLLIIKDGIIELLPADKKSTEVLGAVEDMFIEFVSNFEELSTMICDALIEVLLQESGYAEQLRSVNDLPRLYRKTNREVPTRCSNYVEQLLRSLKTFVTHDKYLGGIAMQNVLTQLCSRITNEYFTAVSDVLSSVQKTEESLRRLRNLKSSAVSATSSGTTDDDKIRLQLRVDVRTWKEELQKLNLLTEKIEKLQELYNIVEESIKIKE